MDNASTCNILLFSLPEIAEWSQTNKGKVEIPAFQRGLVWNAAQIEVLWDSLMRHIPIGSFSLLPRKGNEQYSKSKDNIGTADGDRHYFLLDGQQRANAIAIGLQSFPPSNNDSPILWIDILPPQALKDRSNRKFFFYLTTPARPWGYRIDDARTENRSAKVSVSQYKAILNEAGFSDGEEVNLIKKPAPEELWPVCAGLPMPITTLLAYKEEGSFVEAIYRTTAGKMFPWINHFWKVLGGDQPEKKQAEAREQILYLQHQLNTVIADTQVMAMVAPEGLANEATNKNQDDDRSGIALYFTRLNRGGTPPSREDLDYSILKSILPSLSAIDDCAKERMHPSRLANLAMLSFLSTESGPGWKHNLSRHDIFMLKEKPDFARYINENLLQDIITIDTWLLRKKEMTEYGLPPFLRTRLAQRQPNLYRFLLILAGQMRNLTSAPDGFAKVIVAFSTIMAWFGNDEKLKFAELAKHTPEIAGSISISSILRIFGEWMASQIESGALNLPPSLNYFRNIETAVDIKDENAVNRAWLDPEYSAGAERIRQWHTEEGQSLVLYACRDYLSRTFGEYDSAMAVWNEDSRPWDYDHIIPQAWLKGTYQGDFHVLVARFLNSIGNIAPIPFGANRSKHDTPPGMISLYTQQNQTDALFIKFDLNGELPFFVNNNSYDRLEKDQKLAFEFALVTAHRMAILYNEWWHTLAIEELLNDCYMESRKLEIEDFTAEFKNQFPQAAEHIRTVYIAADGSQHDVSQPWDWARPWISCGIAGFYRKNAGEPAIRCFLCKTFQVNNNEYGLRRHPDETHLDGKNAWWIADHYHQAKDGDFFEYAECLLCSDKGSGESFECDKYVELRK